MDGRESQFPSVSLSVVAIACTLACASPAFGQPITIPTERMEVGSPPPDFEFWQTGGGRPAQWTVVIDATADGGRAVEQVSTDKTDSRFPLAIYKPTSAQDVDVRLRFKPISGAVDQAGGIAVRLLTPGNYYLVRANALENNVRFYRVIDGKREQLASADVTVSRNEWHELGLRAEGDRFTISFDGKHLYTTSDKTLTRSGKIALWTKADSVTRFDRVRIQILP
jgi:hypothetical protein